MPVVDQSTANRAYPLPNGLNDLDIDVVRLIGALTGIDADMAAVFLALGGKSAVGHGHAISEIEGLTDALAAKSAVGHTHTLDELTGVSVSGAANGQFLKLVGTTWQPADIVAGDIKSGTIADARLPERLSVASLDAKANLDGASVIIPSGTTAERPASPTGGRFRLNTETGKFEGYNGIEWGNIAGGEAFIEPFVYTAAGGETSVAVTGGYTPEVGWVTLNGSAQTAGGVDVDLSSGTGVGLTTPLSPGDELVFYRLSTFNVADAVPLSGKATLAEAAAGTDNDRWMTPLRTRQAIAAAPPKNYVGGLTLANNATDASNDVDVAPGDAASDGSPSTMMSLNSAITKRLDAAWAVGTGNGGLDTGSKAADTFYYPWLIQRSDTGVVDVLFSASRTSPTLPANYDRKRRLPGAVRTDGSGNIRAFVQRGREIQYVTPIVDHNAVASTISRALRAVTVPPGAMARIRVGYSNANSGTNTLIVGSPNEIDLAPSITATGVTLVTPGQNLLAVANIDVRTDESSRIAERGGNGAGTLYVITYGYIDDIS